MRATPGQHRWGLVAALWLIAGMLLGCAHAAEQVAQKTATTAVKQTSEELAEPKNQQLMVEFWSNPALQTATRQLAASATDGTLDALTEPQRAQRIAQLSGQFVETIAEAFAKNIRRHVAPQMLALTADAVDAGMQRALSESNRAAARQLVAELTQASAEAMTASMLDARFNRAVAGTTQQIAFASMVGVQRGLTENIPEGREGTLLGFARGLSGRAMGLMQLLVLALVLGAIGLVLLIAWLRARTRREEAEIRRREAGTLFLIQALKAGDEKAWSTELRDLVRDALQDLAADPKPRHTH